VKNSCIETPDVIGVRSYRSNLSSCLFYV